MAFDLDDQELEATRKLHGVGREKTADEMFEELLYRKNYEDKHRVNYESLEKDTALCPIIDFDKDFKQIRIWNAGIGLQELQAINKKVQELGWIVKE